MVSELCGSLQALKMLGLSHSLAGPYVGRRGESTDPSLNQHIYIYLVGVWW